MNIQLSDATTIANVANILKAGQLVAFPTETVYGLGADATNDSAVAAIFATKHRPTFNPLIAHVSSVTMAKEYVAWNDYADMLATRFWPGPLTLVLPRCPNSPLSLLCSAGGDTVGIRFPAHPVAQALIAAVGRPLAAPSANRSGRISPTTAAHVWDELGNTIPLILDGGPCAVGVESTVLDVSTHTPVLLRPGAITPPMIEQVIGQSLAHSGNTGKGALKSPGLLESHYAPSLPVRLNATLVHPREALLAFGPKIPDGAARAINLSEQGDCVEAAARLFAALRNLDSPEYTSIAVMPIPEEGIGLAINDRLRRAASPRPQ